MSPEHSATSALRHAARAERELPAREVTEKFHQATVWVELTDSGAVKIGEDGWVAVYSSPELLPGGMLEGPAGWEHSSLEVEATEISGERLRRMVGDTVGIILDPEYDSECRIQIPLAEPVTGAANSDDDRGNGRD